MIGGFRPGVARIESRRDAPVACGGTRDLVRTGVGHPECCGSGSPNRWRAPGGAGGPAWSGVPAGGGATGRKGVRGFRVPGSVLYGSARTAALFHTLGAIELPACGLDCSGPVPGRTPQVVSSRGSSRSPASIPRRYTVISRPPCGMDERSISQVRRFGTHVSRTGRFRPYK